MNAPVAGLVVVSTDVLVEIVRAAVRDELGREPAEAKPALMTADQLAREIGVSPRTVRRLRAEGMPVVQVTPETTRYVLADAIEWLRERGDRTS